MFTCAGELRLVGIGALRVDAGVAHESVDESLRVEGHGFGDVELWRKVAVFSDMGKKNRSKLHKIASY